MGNEIHKSIIDIVNTQRQNYLNGKLYDIEYRIKLLKKLKASILQHKCEIVKAIEVDFGVNGEYDAYGRMYCILDEINNFIKYLRVWLKPEKVCTPLILQPGSSRYIYEPLGVILIIGAWNAPFAVNILPLIAAIGAGNCSVIKPSELAPESSHVIASIVNVAFDKGVCTVVEGGRAEVEELLDNKFDLICYTGGSKVGHIIYQAAARQFTPVILELGGKSPCIVDNTANIKVSAKRICQAKHLISGQVCTSPDYLLVHSDVKNKFIDEMKKHLDIFYPDGALVSDDYSKIINKGHFERLLSIMGKIPAKNIVFGGKYDNATLKIEPTIIDNVDWSDNIMEEEIFGPIIPIIEYTDLEDTIKRIRHKPKPLALYIYSKSKHNINRVINNTTSGGVGVNISIQHFLNKNLPFGGVGNSGIGRYRGEFGLYSFSNQKAIYNKSVCLETSLMDPPYGGKVKYIKRLVR